MSYEYNAARGEYVPVERHRHGGGHHRPRASSHPPPLPPKEFGDERGEYVVSPVKETQHADVEGEFDRMTLDSERAGSLGRAARRLSQGTSASEPRKRRKIRVLSLDGGGIRGFSTLLILQELMHQIYVHEHDGHPPSSPRELPRPCDYFDLIGGNGTGGLIALMLGRMRMDVESCKEYYVDLTRFVFITDKTLMGVPYGKTLFKARRLEEAIKYCVKESTRFDTEKIIPHSPPPGDDGRRHSFAHRRTDSWKRRNESRSSVPAAAADERGRSGYHSSRRVGNPEAPLLDQREGACKTFVTAMLQGSRKHAAPVLLRSYPSPAESSTSYRTTIWQAGRATCATAAAFKPITIDQITFLDEGGGKYNPAIQALDEAHKNEFPDDDIAVFVSVGTGKRRPGEGPSEKHEWWEGMVSTSFDNFAEARRRLVRRVDDCERVHRELVDGVDGGRPGLAQRGVATQDYYRFNVEVGVGEFGMNEWNRLAEVSTGTKRYLQQRETAALVRECAKKIVDIELGNVSDGSKVHFRPSTHVNNGAHGDGHYAELPATSTPPPGVIMPEGPLIDNRHGRHGGHRQTYSASARPTAHMPSVDEALNMHVPPPPPPPPPAIPAPPDPPYAPADIGSPPPIPKKEHERYGHTVYADYSAAAPETPEIRVTSPTTVADDSGDDDEEMYPGWGRRRKLHRKKGRKPPYPMEGVAE